MTIIAAADGSALGNPGPAGWAWYIDDASWAAGGWDNATNNRGELQAVLELLCAVHAAAQAGTIPGDEGLRILCDSQYVINAVTKWMAGWKRKGWKKADGKAVLNRDLLEQLDAALAEVRAEGRAVDFEWVKGHNNHPLNEAADARARGAAEAFRRGEPPQTGPGLAGAPSAAREARSGAAPTRASGAEKGEGRPAPATAAEPTGAPGVKGAAGASGAPSGAGAVTTVACSLPGDVAAQIVRRAKAAGRRPQEELAELIMLGLAQRYGGAAAADSPQ